MLSFLVDHVLYLILIFWGTNWKLNCKRVTNLVNHVKNDPIYNQLSLKVKYLNKLKHYDVIEELSSNT